MVEETDGREPKAPADDTGQQILEAAARLFAENGYARTTTRALAEAAGVNEVTLFRHFGSKGNLFAAVVETYAAPGLSAALAIEVTGDLRRDLEAMGTQVLDLLLERGDAMRLMLCEAEHFPEVRQVLAQNPRHLRQMLAGYLQRQIDAGRVRPLHVEAAAQAFWGMFFAYSISVWLLDEPVEPELDAHALVAAFVDVFVRGIAAGGGGSPAGARPETEGGADVG
ncbi:MAG: TetR/AcrR family transcriptional regulator [Anaerolineae bacterium]|jgi:AcrR family transcriptional regulator